MLASNVVLDRGEPTEWTVAPLRVRLLGGFRVERADGMLSDSAWKRRSAKTLTKLLATHPRHALHREQILEILWPDVPLKSALNSFGKALHAARRACEPELLPREDSAYLRLRDEMLMLDTEYVLIDSDHFQQLAERALQLRSVSGYETALAAYAGELLPEDRYEDWSVARRHFLTELHIGLLLGLADALEKRGAYSQAAGRLSAVLEEDPTREEVHRRLMRLYAETGARHQAVRQFQVCQDVLRRDLDLVPERETEALYQDILENRIQRRTPTLESGVNVVDSHRLQNGDRTLATPFVGRTPALQLLDEQLTRAEEGKGGMTLVSGEAGVGKTRLVAEFAAEARRHGVSVLWSESRGHANYLPYGPFAVALEGYVASRPDTERNELARRYPELTRFVPSLGIRNQLPPFTAGPNDDHLNLFLASVRLLTDLTETGTLLVVFDDLRDTYSSNIELLEYLAQLAIQRRWLIIGVFREEGSEAGSELQRMFDATTRERVCLHLEVHRLMRQDCDRLVQALLPGGVVDDALVDHIYKLSLGNPLFVTELIREMQERNELVLAAGYWHKSSYSGRVPGWHWPLPLERRSRLPSSAPGQRRSSLPS